MDAADKSAQPDPLDLTAEQRELLYWVACRLVERAARGERAAVSEYSLGQLAAHPLVGAFVTLRKNGELRGCIGNFGTATSLGSALEQAAVGVVSHDPRFLPISTEELPELTLTVSLLHNRELIKGSPEERISQVSIGQHGLDIQYQGRKGLLLPSVATDFGLDAAGFLQAVCRKANVPDDAWQHPDAGLYRFSATAFGGPWKPDE